MTREEAIELLEERKKFNRTMQRGWEQSEGVTASGKTVNTASFAKQNKDEADALDIALTALRPVSREQVEKVWRGEWMGSADGYADGELVYDIWTCSECGYVIDEEDDPDMLPQFCPKCYAAMTDEAVQMVMKRLEALYETI